jgi:hypothetical protein
MAALIDAIDIKRKTFLEIENTPFVCLEAEVSTPSARGAQTVAPPPSAAFGEAPTLRKSWPH